MNNLTAEKCRDLIEDLKSHKMAGFRISSAREGYLAALEIALPILEQQERGEATGNLKHVGYLFVNSGGGVVYSPSGYGMRGFTCAGKIYGDVNLQQDPVEGEWIDWKGGNCPVHVNHAVEVKLRDGTVSSALPTDGWVWEHGVLSSGADIIAYRIIPEQTANQNGEQ